MNGEDTEYNGGICPKCQCCLSVAFPTFTYLNRQSWELPWPSSESMRVRLKEVEAVQSHDPFVVTANVVIYLTSRINASLHLLDAPENNLDASNPGHNQGRESSIRSSGREGKLSHSQAGHTRSRKTLPQSEGKFLWDFEALHKWNGLQESTAGRDPQRKCRGRRKFCEAKHAGVSHQDGKSFLSTTSSMQMGPRLWENPEECKLFRWSWDIQSKATHAKRAQNQLFLSSAHEICSKKNMLTRLSGWLP